MKRKIYCLLSGILVSLTAFSVNDTLGIPGEDRAAIGIYIYDLKADTVVASCNPDLPIVPASVTKMVTTATSLTLLGKDFRYKTTAKLTGTRGKNNDIWLGDLVVSGGGDPTLDSEYFEEYAGITDSIVVALKRMGITEIHGCVDVVDNMLESGPVDSWAIDDVPWYYGAGIYGLNWRDNTCRVWTASGKTQPNVPDMKVIYAGRRAPTMTRGIDSETLRVGGKNARRKNNTLVTTIPYPHKAFAYNLIQKLADEGIEVLQEHNKKKSNDETVVYTHYSPLLKDILHSLMVRSDNMYAEGILRAFEPDSARELCLTREFSLWESRGVNTDGVTILDGSGLSRANVIPPIFLADVLKYMYHSDSKDLFVSLFPVAGKNGTMRNFMKDTELDGRLALKTGSMNSVQTYAGYALDETGEPTHIVVIMANSYPCSRARLREGIAELLLSKLVHNDE